MKVRKDYTPTIEELDNLWSKAVKARAGMKSEYKPAEGDYLVSHHILKKPTLALRYNLNNGVCITSMQHNFEAHCPSNEENFKQWALSKRGVTEDYLRLTSRNLIDRFAVKLYLEQECIKYEKYLQELKAGS